MNDSCDLQENAEILKILETNAMFSTVAASLLWSGPWCGLPEIQSSRTGKQV